MLTRNTGSSWWTPSAPTPFRFAIPIHLITKQALEIYRDRLLPDGVLCMHISNRYLNLEPVLANIVEELGMAGCHMSDDEGADDRNKYRRDWAAPGKNTSHWVAIAKKKEHLAKLFHPATWEIETRQLSPLGAALWPAQATTGLATATGMCYAFHRIAAIASDKEWKENPKSEWKPLNTSKQIDIDLEEAESDLKKAEEELAKTKSDAAEKALKRARMDRDELVKKKANSRRVGVWTDDYSNILSVFGW
jgi:hypothetical protein